MLIRDGRRNLDQKIASTNVAWCGLVFLFCACLPLACSSPRSGLPSQSISTHPTTAEVGSLPEDDYDALFQALRSIQNDYALVSPYFDIHGNAVEDVKTLMKARFHATHAICTEIDRADTTRNDKYTELLYYMLGKVKDPGTIPWIKEKLDGPQSHHVEEMWLRMWLGGSSATVYYQTVKWLERTDLWSDFFITWIDQEHDPAIHLNLLKALYTKFHNARTITFFENLLSHQNATGEELLLALTYLSQHRRPVDAKQLESYLDGVKPLSAEVPMILKYCRQMRHGAFVPWLLSLDESQVVDRRGSTLSLDRELRRITFCRDISGREAWEAWYKQHKDQPRRDWVEEALEDFETVLAKNPSAALSILEEERYNWYEPSIHEHVLRWAKNKELHAELVHWIRASSHPYWIGRLKPVADVIIDQSHDALGPNAIRSLRKLDFLEGDYWEEQFRWHFL